MHAIFHKLQAKLHIAFKKVCAIIATVRQIIDPYLTVFERIESQTLRGVLYNTFVITTYVLLSRTFKLYFIENIAPITAIYAVLSRITAVVVILLFLLYINELPQKKYIAGVVGIYALMGFSTLINTGNFYRFISSAYPMLAMCAFVILMCRTIESTKRFVKTMSSFFTVVMAANLLFALVLPGLFGRTTSDGIIFLVGIENQIIYSQTIGLLFAILNDRLNGNRLVLQIYTTIYVITTLINFSLSAVAGTCILLAYFAIPFVKRFFNNRNFGFALGLFALIFTVLVFFSEPVLNLPPIRFIIEEILHKTTTLTHRTILWDMAIEGILRRPFFGYGLGDTGNLFQILVYGETKFWSAHNQYLQFAYEYGLITLSAFVAYVLFYTKKLDKSPDRKLPGLIKAISFSIMIMYLLEAPSFNALFFILTLGVCVCHVYSNDDSCKSSECPNRITVVVPVYNVEDFLPECLESIINQSYTNLEILVVNDGSTDGSLQICNEYANKDERIKVITQENAGLSAARNTAIKAATGTYITFVDSDDYIDPDMIRVLYAQLTKNNADMSVCQFTPVNEDSILLEQDRYYPSFTVEGNSNCMREFFLDTGIKTCAWGKLHRTTMFEQLMYPVGKYHEDVYTTYRIVALCEKIAVCSEPMYFYRQRSNSIIHHSFSPKHLDAVHACLERADYVINKYDNLNSLALSSVIYSCNSCAKRLIGIDKVDEEILSFMQKQYRKYEVHFLLSHSTIQAKLFSLFACINLKKFLEIIDKCINAVRRIRK